jgi:hypothetical protein
MNIASNLVCPALTSRTSRWFEVNPDIDCEGKAILPRYHNSDSWLTSAALGIQRQRWLRGRSRIRIGIRFNRKWIVLPWWRWRNCCGRGGKIRTEGKVWTWRVFKVCAEWLTVDRNRSSLVPVGAMFKSGSNTRCQGSGRRGKARSSFIDELESTQCDSWSWLNDARCLRLPLLFTSTLISTSSSPLSHLGVHLHPILLSLSLSQKFQGTGFKGLSQHKIYTMEASHPELKQKLQELEHELEVS